MNKSTHFTGQPIYGQLLKLVNKQEILQLSRKGGYERYVKKLDGYTHFVILLYAVLMRYDSLREIIIGMLSEANNRSSSEFLGQIYQSLYAQHKHILADSPSTKDWEKKLYVMDSTTITLFSNILKGAGRNPKQGKKKG